MQQSPAAAASSQATRCSLRAPAHVPPPSHSPRSPSRPHQSIQSDPFCHVSLHTPDPALLTREDTSYDPAALSLHDDDDDDYCLPARRARQSPKALSTAFIDGCRPLVDRATSSLAAFQNQRRGSVPSPTKSPAEPAPPVFSPAGQRPSRLSSVGHWFIPFAPSRHPDHSDSDSDIGSDSDLDSDSDSDDHHHHRYTTMDSSNKRATVGSMKSVKSLKRSSTHGAPAANNPPPAQGPSIFASWFSRKADPKRNLPQDPLSVLDIEAALFPNGPADPQDPASFHNLHKASVALLQQFQHSYKAMQLCMQDTRLEEDGLIEEKKQIEVHARNLQMQLDNLKAESEQREKENQALREALEREAQLRADEEEARIASIRAMKACKCNRKSTASSTISSEPSGVLSDRDSGFESEGETVTDDLAFRSRPTSMVSESELDSTPSTAPTSAPSPVETAKPTLFTKRKSALDNSLQKKRASKAGGVMPIILTGAGKMNDTNGQMDVWRENRELRERVENLERTVDETLGIVGGLAAGVIY